MHHVHNIQMELVSELHKRIQQMQSSEQYYRNALQDLASTRLNIQSQIDALSVEYTRKIRSLQQKLESFKTQNEGLVRQNDLLRSDLETYQSRLLQKDKLINLLLTQTPRLENSREQSQILDFSYAAKTKKENQDLEHSKVSGLEIKNTSSIFPKTGPSFYHQNQTKNVPSNGKVNRSNVPPPPFVAIRKSRAQTTEIGNSKNSNKSYNSYAQMHQHVQGRQLANQTVDSNYLQQPLKQNEKKYSQAHEMNDQVNSKYPYQQQQIDEYYETAQDPQPHEQATRNQQPYYNSRSKTKIDSLQLNWQTSGTQLFKTATPKKSQTINESSSQFFRQLSLNGSQQSGIEQSVIEESTISRDHSIISQDNFFQSREVIPSARMVKKKRGEIKVVNPNAFQ